MAAISTVGMLALLAAPAQAAAPPNDNLAQAEPVQAAVAGTLNEATFEPGEEAATESVDAHAANWGTVWYAYTPANNVSATVRAAGKNGFQSKLKVFTGTSYADLTLVSSDPPSPCPGGSFAFETGGCETFAASSGTTYLIQVINHNISYAGNHNFDLTITESGVGSISGTVHDETNSPLGGVCVKSYTGTGTFHAQATTASNGTYSVPAPSGSDRVEFSDCNETTQAFTEWHNDKSSFATADAINVPAGGNANIGVTKIQRGVRISGTVSADGGGPLSDACVTIFNATAGAQTAFEITAGDGAYDKLLPSGEYEVQFRQCGSPRVYAAEWYDDAFSQAAATTIELGAGEAFEADAGLAPGGTISGTFSYVDPDDEDTCIEAHPAGGDGVTASAETTPDASDTSYELSGLAAGSYRIKMFSCDGPTPGPAVWSPLHHAFAFGQTVAVTAGGTTDLPLSFGDPTAVGAQVRDSGALRSPASALTSMTLRTVRSPSVQRRRMPTGRSRSPG